MDSISVSQSLWVWGSGSGSLSGFSGQGRLSHSAASAFNVKCQSKIAQINGKQVENLIRNAIVAAHLRRASLGKCKIFG